MKTKVKSNNKTLHSFHGVQSNLPEILFITSYPPRECGIATYSEDLIKALNNKFERSFSIKVCALESDYEKHHYAEEVHYRLDASKSQEYISLASFINHDARIKMVLIQHEFGLFLFHDEDFQKFLDVIKKPVSIVFHTVLPLPGEKLKLTVQRMASSCESVVVMTHNAAQILQSDYALPLELITIIPHGTHLVPHKNAEQLKKKYGLTGRKVLSTFGLLSSGKSIETSLEALPAIIKANPEVVLLIIGKTHPTVIKAEGEKYRSLLEAIVVELKIDDQVKFVNAFLSLPTLLEYLQLTDIYLFTSKDPNQAVSGTFAYALSCACPIISTPIPHAREMLRDDTGIIFDFQNSKQLAHAANQLLNDDALREKLSDHALQRVAPTAWENIAVSHVRLFSKIASDRIVLHYKLPPINLDHFINLTTDFGIIQFSKINRPDRDSGYTLDDNARALTAMCLHYELTGDEFDVNFIRIYLNFVQYCLQGDGCFLNYVDINRNFTEQNYHTNLEDANGRALWALGHLISNRSFLPESVVMTAEDVMQKALLQIENIDSPRAIAFAIKGLYYLRRETNYGKYIPVIQDLAMRLVNLYKQQSENEWRWFEGYMTYGNSILPEALLCAWSITKKKIYKDIAKLSFEFLLSKIFTGDVIKVISNRSWLQKGHEGEAFGEQPIDVAYTILALEKFYEVFQDSNYLHKMKTAFDWFLSKNHLHQIIYNPCTGGCYDGLEETQVNLNQGAESTISYLLARLTMEKLFPTAKRFKMDIQDKSNRAEYK